MSFSETIASAEYLSYMDFGRLLLLLHSHLVLMVRLLLVLVHLVLVRRFSTVWFHPSHVLWLQLRISLHNACRKPLKQYFNMNQIKLQINKSANILEMTAYSLFNSLISEHFHENAICYLYSLDTFNLLLLSFEIMKLCNNTFDFSFKSALGEN